MFSPFKKRQAAREVEEQRAREELVMRQKAVQDAEAKRRQEINNLVASNQKRTEELTSLMQQVLQIAPQWQHSHPEKMRAIIQRVENEMSELVFEEDIKHITSEFDLMFLPSRKERAQEWQTYKEMAVAIAVIEIILIEQFQVHKSDLLLLRLRDRLPKTTTIDW